MPDDHPRGPYFWGMAAHRKKDLLPGHWKIFRNKYFLAGFSLLIWLTFFDRNDFISRYQYSRKLHELRKEQQYYLEEIARTRRDMDDLLGNPKNLEKYAREQYLMKKENEDIFILVPAGKNKDNG
jgi:cell division protein DivIC